MMSATMDPPPDASSSLLSKQSTPSRLRPAHKPGTGHLHLLLALLSFIGMLASFEISANASDSQRWVDLLLALGCGVFALWSMHRYLHQAMRPDPRLERMTEDGDGE